MSMVTLQPILCRLPDTCRVTGPMFETIGWGTYAFFAAMNLVIIWPTVYILFPETKLRSLEDVSAAFLLLRHIFQD